jgi:hypothetical protein
LTSRGLVDGFVVATADDGTVRWASQVGGSGADGIWAVAHDAAGNVYLTGEVSADADLGDGATTGGMMSDFFVAAYAAADGAHLWSARFGSDENDRGVDVLIDAEGMVAVVGEVGAEVSFGGGLSEAGAFLARWRASDAMLMTERRFGAGRAHPISLRESSVGFVISGNMDDGFLAAGVPFLPVGGTDVFVARLPASGSAGADGLVFGGMMDDAAFGAVEASDGSLTVAASFEGATAANDGMVTDTDAGAGAIVFTVTRD